MKLSYLIPLAAILTALTGCATTYDVAIMKPQTMEIRSASLVLRDNASAKMNSYLQSALTEEGLEVKASVPQGTKNSKDVDILVNYIDVWGWDVITFLRSVSIQFADASSGDVLAIGHANNTQYFHGNPDPQTTMRNLVKEMIARLRSTSK